MFEVHGFGNLELRIALHAVESMDTGEIFQRLAPLRSFDTHDPSWKLRGATEGSFRV